MGGHTHIVVKFCKCHKAMVVLKESNNFQENILYKILEFYELKHPKSRLLSPSLVVGLC
jgi:hypothetical protein